EDPRTLRHGPDPVLARRRLALLDPGAADPGDPADAAGGGGQRRVRAAAGARGRGARARSRPGAVDRRPAHARPAPAAAAAAGPARVAGPGAAAAARLDLRGAAVGRAALLPGGGPGARARGSGDQGTAADPARPARLRRRQPDRRWPHGPDPGR